MKKVLFILLGIIGFIIAALVMINLFDESPHPQAMTLKDLPPTSFDAENGFYIWWGLAEPESLNLKSEEYTTIFKQYFDPSPGNEKFLGELGTKDYQEYRRKFDRYKNFINKIEFPKNFPEDCFSTMNSKWAKVEEAQQNCALILKRYNELLHAPIIRDFTYPSPYSYIPNLLAVLKTAKLYTAICMARAVRGEWVEAAAGLIAQVDCTRRFLPYSRALVNAAIAKAVMYYSLQGLVSLLNHPQCPKEVFSMVMADLPPLTYEEYGNRPSFIAEALSFCLLLDEIKDEVNEEKRKHLYAKLDILGELVLQRNTTKNYFYEYFSRALKYDRQDPYLWQDDPKKELEAFIESKTTGFLWQLKNASGKVFFSVGTISIAPSLFKSLRLRVTVDMIRILAELKLKYLPGKKIADLLTQLETYKTVDPGSGKPYKWNPEKQVLYSIGMDKTDNSGVVILGKSTGTDVAIPIKIY